MNMIRLRQYFNAIQNLSDFKAFGLKRQIKYWNFLRYKLTRLEADSNRLACAPVIAYLWVTKRCNLACPYCVCGAPRMYDNRDDFEMSIDDCAALLSHPVVRKALVVIFGGGEPLLNGELFHMVEAARAGGHLAALVTNGTLLEKHFDDLLAAKLAYLNVSLHGEYTRISTDALAGLAREILIRTNIPLKKSDLADYERLEKGVRLSLEAGCSGILFQMILPNSDKGNDEIIYEHDLGYRKLQSFFHEKYGHRIQMNWPAPAVRTIQASKKKCCRIPWWNIMLDARGGMGLCCRYQEGKFGNIFLDPVETLGMTKAWREVKQGLLAKDNSIPDLCRDCALLTESFASNV